MATSIEMLELRIEALRTQVRQALMAGDRTLAASLRRELRQAEREWDDALDFLAHGDPGAQEAAPAHRGQHHRSSQPGKSSASVPPGAPGAGQPDGTGGAPPSSPSRPWRDDGAAASPGHATASPPAGLSLPLREQVHQALTLLTVPAAPRLISAVHEAFFAGAIFGARLTSLRRDEERSFRTAPFARPYYICAAVTADLLAPARGLLAVSTWPMESRVIGPLSPRVDFLTAAIAVAEGIQRIPAPSPAALRLLWRFATNIPGGTGKVGAARGLLGVASAPAVAQAARAEREIHAEADLATRRAAALRARSQLDDAQQLFGTRLRVTPQAGTAP